MVKVIGMIVIMLSSTVCGYMIRYGYQKRIKLLDNMKSCLSVIENEIRYSQSDIEKTINKTVTFSTDSNKIMFESFLEKIKNSNGEPLSDIWNATAESIQNFSCYDKSDIEVFKTFGNVLGCGDVDTQMKNIEFFRAQLDAQLGTANEKYSKHGELIGKIGIYIGILAVIIFW